MRDHRTDILLNGVYTYAQDSRIEQPHFRLQQRLGSFGRKLVADTARYAPPQDGRPGGYLLEGVQHPENLNELPTAMFDGQPVIYSPLDTDWLGPDQCFVASDIDFQRLAGGTQWQQLASTGELFSGLRNPSHDLGLDARVTIHSRLVQPLLDVALFFLGIPLVLTRESRNAFVAVGSCLGVAVCFSNRRLAVPSARESWLLAESGFGRVGPAHCLHSIGDGGSRPNLGLTDCAEWSATVTFIVIVIAGSRVRLR